MNNTISKRAVSFTTSGVMSVRTLVEVLSGIITETPWVIYGPDKNDPNKFSGIEISTADPSRTIFIKVRLFSSSSEFIEFSCKYEKLELGISLINLHKLKVYEGLSHGYTEIFNELTTIKNQLKKYPDFFRYKIKKGCHPKAELQFRFNNPKQVIEWKKTHK
jgi:hypothetical protein